MGKRGAFRRAAFRKCASSKDLKYLEKSSYGQISLEFAIIIGFVTLILIPLISVFYFQIRDTNNQIIVQQCYKIAKEVVDKSEQVYYLGAPSKTVLKVYIPEHVESIQINNKEVVFKIKIAGTLSDAVAISDVNITGTISPTEGIHYISVEAMGAYVKVTG